MKHILLIIIFIPNISYAQYFEPFSTQDWVLQSVYTGFAVIDWAQTKEFRKQGRREKNGALGSEPSQDRIDLLIPTAIAADWLFIYTIKKEYRPYFQVPAIFAEFLVVLYVYRGLNRIRINVNYSF